MNYPISLICGHGKEASDQAAEATRKGLVGFW